MPTRADFYCGTGPHAEWLGSITYDGSPDGDPSPIFDAATESEYRRLVSTVLDSASLSTLPADGWPWPWDDSRTTDYAYTWSSGGVVLSEFGCQWQSLSDYADRVESDDEDHLGVESIADESIADMSGRRNNSIVLQKSGLVLIK